MHKRLLKQLIFAFAVGFLLFGFSAEAQTKRAKKKLIKQTIKQMDGKIIYEPDADLLKEMREQISIVESKKDWVEFNRQRLIINPSGNRSAYVAQFKIAPDGEALIDVVVVHDSATDKFYEIRGFNFPRPFENLKWTSDDALQFDQWVNPRNGGRYRVNLETGKIISAGYLRSN